MNGLVIPTPVLVVAVLGIVAIAAFFIFRPKREPATLLDAVTAVFD